MSSGVGCLGFCKASMNCCLKSGSVCAVVAAMALNDVRCRCLGGMEVEGEGRCVCWPMGWHVA